MLPKLYDLDETPNALVIRKRPLPYLFGFLFGVAWFAFAGWIVAHMWDDLGPDKGSWLPPLDRLPGEWKAVLFWAIVAVALVVVGALAAHFIRQLLIAVNGETFAFDLWRQAVMRQGKPVATFAEIKEIRLETDSDRESLNMTLVTAKRTISIFNSAVMGRLDSLRDLGRRIEAQTGIAFVDKTFFEKT